MNTKLSILLYKILNFENFALLLYKLISWPSLRPDSFSFKSKYFFHVNFDTK